MPTPDLSALPRLLVVEDDPRNRRTLGMQLGTLGVAADFVVSGEQALEQWPTRRYPIVLMDIRLPGIDGRQTARQLRTLAGEETLHIIAQTAFAAASQRTALLQSGMDDYLAKPIQLEALRQALAQARAALTASA
jgi:CheY-like chemotaxis protein